LAINLIIEQLKQLPGSPGVYRMKDATGNIIYVGKASNLRNRVRSYFSARSGVTPKTQQLVEQIDDFDFFVTASEQEALILEFNLIKQHRPPYNIRLKDDKSYPYLKIDITEEWPRLYITRHLDEDGNRYFGPFASPRSVRETIKVLKNIFPLRSCTKPITGTEKRPCLEYHMHRCPGPCIGATNRESYADTIKEVIFFLEGKQERVVRKLERRMQQTAISLDFERAAMLRDQIQAINLVIEGQQIAAKVSGEQDVVAFVSEKDQAYVQVFFIRGGKLIGRESFVLQGVQSEEPLQIMTGFVKQYYASTTQIPPLLLLQHPIEDKVLIEQWLHSRRGSRVRIQVPRRGEKKQLVDIVAENARRGLEQLKIKQLASALAPQTLAELQQNLSLPRLPTRIEGYDISNIQGKMAVGSMVVFEEGKPKTAHYRRFRIKTVAGANDYAMLQEVIKRRFKHVKDGDASDAWAILPDLVLVDGGKGQLSAVMEAMQATGAEKIPVAGLAKENEQIFIPGQSEPIILPRNSPVLQLLQRVRDEAHRFAVTYHRETRKKAAFVSALDGAPGIGPVRKRALLKHFGTARAVREASLDELAEVKGMTAKLAQKMKEYL
jgi:excinuclease ABC subunit C